MSTICTPRWIALGSTSAILIFLGVLILNSLTNQVRNQTVPYLPTWLVHFLPSFDLALLPPDPSYRFWVILASWDLLTLFYPHVWELLKPRPFVVLIHSLNSPRVGPSFLCPCFFLHTFSPHVWSGHSRKIENREVFVFEFYLAFFPITVQFRSPN